MSLRAARKYRGDISLQDPVGTDREGNEQCVMDVLPCTGRAVEDEVELRISAQKLFGILEAALTPRELTVVALRYGLQGEEMTQREIAKLLGISRSYVSRIEKKALQKLNRHMEV